MITPEIIDFFGNALKIEYDTNSDFYNYINDFAPEFEDYDNFGWAMDGITVHSGSERACVIFDGFDHPLFKKYCVKFSLDLNRKEADQCEKELYNYNCISNYDFKDMFSEIARGGRLCDIFENDEIDESNYFYIVERTIIDPEESYNVLRDYIYKNWGELTEDYLPKFYQEDISKTIEELSKEPNSKKHIEDYIKYDVVIYVEDFMTTSDKFYTILRALGYTSCLNDFNFLDVIDTVGDMHEGNFSIYNGKVKITDYGSRKVY